MPDYGETEEEIHMLTQPPRALGPLTLQVLDANQRSWSVIDPYQRGLQLMFPCPGSAGIASWDMRSVGDQPSEGSEVRISDDQGVFWVGTIAPPEQSQPTRIQARG